MTSISKLGFFDLSDRYAVLDPKYNPLAEINEIVPWEEFFPLREQAWCKTGSVRKSRTGRKPMDVVRPMTQSTKTNLLRAQEGNKSRCPQINLVNTGR